MAAYYGYLEPGLYGAAGLVVSDFLLSPDLDGVRSNAKRRWRYIGLHWLFRWYERLPHRSPLSHWPVLANLVMLGYFMLLAAAGMTVVNFAKNCATVFLFVYDFVTAYPLQCGSAFLGYCAMTGFHGFADWITKEGEKRED